MTERSAVADAGPDPSGADAGSREPATAEHPLVVRLGVPVGLGVLTWLAIVIPAGALLGGLSFATVLAVVLGGLLAWPVYSLRPRETGVTDRALATLARHRRSLLVGVALFALARLPVASDLLAPVFGLLLLPVRAVPPALTRGTVVYGEPLGGVVFDLGRWYVELLWLSTVGAGVVKLFPREDR